MVLETWRMPPKGNPHILMRHRFLEPNGDYLSDLKFWYHLPVKESVQHTMDCARKGEEVGFDVVSQMDHFPYKSKQMGCIPECWTLLTAVGTSTNLTVSPLVMCSLFRNPALLAKMVTTLDQLTRGRVYLAVGAGWWEDEFRAYGYDWMSPKKRVDRTIEAVRIIKKLWTEEKVDFRGEFWRIENCELVPRPYSDPHPPLLNGGGGPRMLKMAGELCDGWVTGDGDLEQFVTKRDKVLSYSEGRDMVFGHYITLGEGGLGIPEAGERIEELVDSGVSHVIIILKPDGANASLLEECRDLIGRFR
jgi:alkanesulfonate monooxygenase SsuD/methylene tetrahydromethanopterin reductase-like flavin-dependent oxidoreductase (luciferase family)